MKTQKLAALKKATAVVEEELGKYYTEPGLVINLKKLGSGEYEVHYSYYSEIYTRADKTIKLSFKEWMEWQEWEATRREKLVKEKREEIKSVLRAAGCYQLEAAGMLTAIKIYEMISFYGKPHGLTALELLELEDEMKSDVTHTNMERFMAELPELSTSKGQITITARRALANLQKARLLSSAGRTSGKRYYVEPLQ